MKRVDEAFLTDILEGRTARKTNEKMGNKEGGTNATLDGKPEDESEVEGEAELDAEDTLEAVSKDAVMSPEMKAIQAIADKKKKKNEMSDPGKIDASKKNGDWIKKAVNPKNKGACTPMTKDTCTPARKALAKRFKKAGRKEKKEGGTGWQGKV